MVSKILNDYAGFIPRHLLQVAVLWLIFLVLLHLSRIRDLWKEILLLFCSMILCLGVLSYIGPHILRHIVIRDYNLDIDHRLTYIPGITNEDGVRPSNPPEDYRHEDFNIVLLGDSFTYGLGVPLEDAFPTLTVKLLRERNPAKRFRAINFGYVSSSPVLQKRQLEDIGSKYKPDLVVQCFDMTDFDDDLKASRRLKRMEVKSKKLEQELIHPSIFRAMIIRFSLLVGLDDFPNWFFHNLDFEIPHVLRKRDLQVVSPDMPAPSLPEAAQYWFMWQPLSLSEPFFHLSWDAILEVNALARSMSADYVLIILPRYQQYNRSECQKDPKRSQIPETDEYLFEVFTYFENKRGTVSFPIHSLLEDFRNTDAFPTVFEDDFHINRTGHRIVADAIVRHLISDGLLDNEK